MSKFTEAIQVGDTGLKRPTLSPLNNLRVIEQFPPVYRPWLSNEYAIAATVEYRAVIREDAPAQERAAVIAEAKRALVEEVFGEFRVPLLGLLQALDMQDIQRARDLLSEIERQMFNS